MPALRSATGLVQVTDALALRSGADLTDDLPADRAELVRSAVVLDGNVRLRAELVPRGGGQARALLSGLQVQASRRRTCGWGDCRSGPDRRVRG